MYKTVELSIKELISNVLNESLLTEARSLDSAVEVFKKNNPNLNQDDLSTLMRSDPTFVSNDRGEFIGRYGMWIGNQYVKGNIKPGDRLELTHALNIYNINKSRIAKKINDVQSLDELVELIGDYDDSFKAQPSKGKHADELEKVYEDCTWAVYVPHTWEASRKIGGDTRWCTAGSSEVYYNYYKNNHGGEYYVNVNKVSGDKYQFHFESNQFMDTEDNDIEKPVLDNMGATEGLVNFYRELTNSKPFHWEMLLYDKVRVISNEYAILTKYGKSNIMFVDGKLLWNKPVEQWFDGVGEFSEGFAYVKIDKKLNFISADGKLLLDKPVKEWFDGVWSFDKGFANVRIGNKCNFINTDGKLLWDKPLEQWFDTVYGFNEGFAAVNIGKKWNHIGTNGKLLWNKPVEQWFDSVWSFEEGFASVRIGKKWNCINTDGKLLWNKPVEQWFDATWCFENGLAMVELKGKHYKIDTNGNLYDKDETPVNIQYAQLNESLLAEARSLSNAVDIFRKKNPNLNQGDLEVLMRSDPTFVSNDRGDFIGRYGMWIGNQYVKGNIKPGDRLELTHALNIYHINKSRIAKNINDVQSLDELVELIGDYDDSFKAQPTKGKHADELEKVYEDGTWVVYVPHTWEASRKIGGDTKWCTAASSDNYYNYYKNEYGGEYYVNVNKVTGEKYQFHFETNQFMDTVDDGIKRPVLDTIGATDGLVNFYRELTNGKPFEFAKIVYDSVRFISNEHAIVAKNGKHNVIFVDGKLLWDKPVEQWFDAVGFFYDGFAEVSIGNKWNFINTDGKLLWDKPVKQWFDGVGYFVGGFADVRIGNKWNFISADGKLLWDKPVEQWFDVAGLFFNGLAAVELKGKWYKIDTNGNLHDEDGNPVNTGYGNNQSQVSESKLEHIIKSVLSESLLTEARSLDSAVDIFRKKNPNLNQDDLSTLMRSDPTFVSNNRGDFIGRYGMWIGNQYIKGNIKPGDRLELTHALNIYDINKSRIGKKINDIQSLDELVELIGDYDDSFKAQPTKGKHADELEKVYEDGTWAVYIPHTWEASRKIGGDTKWCTAASSDKYYNHYKNKYGGEYYVNVNKVTGEKYQFHFESNQFMDTEDKEVMKPVLDTIGATDGLVNFYRELMKDKPFEFAKLWYVYVRVISNKCAIVTENGKSNVMFVDGKLLWDKPVEQWFDYVWDLINGFAAVSIGNKWNYISADGKLLWNKPVEQWFDDAARFSEGFAAVKIGKKWNYISTDGKLLWNKPVEQWFDEVYGFSGGFARVRNGDKRNLINTYGKLLCDKPVEQWFDGVGDFYNGIARVRIGLKWSFIDINGRYIIDLWFDAVDDFNNGFSRVRLGKKWNFINTYGKLLWNKPVEQWFDGVGYFVGGFAVVRIGKKWNHINTDGKLLWDKPVEQWFDDGHLFYNGFASVKLKGKLYKLDTNGNLYDEDGNAVNTVNVNNQSQVSESKLEHIIKSVLSESLLTEARSLGSAVDIFRKNNPNLNQDDLEVLMRSDPTFVSNNRGDFIGRYGMWIGNQYVKGNIKLGDRLELSHALNIYDINKSRIAKKINDIQSLDELVELIGDYDDSFKAQPTKGKHADELEKVYEDGTWVVYVPHTWEASRKIGGDTKWCTAASKDNYYNYYKNEYGGEYYVNVNKVTGDKYQFHFESNQFMDKDDKEVKKPVLDTIGATDGLVNFYRELTNDKPFEFAKIQYEYVRVISNEHAIITENGKHNVMRVDGKLLFDQWFDGIGRFSEELASVRIGDKWNYINTDGRLLWNKPVEEWFDYVGDFIEGLALVKLKEKWYKIYTNGNLYDGDGNAVNTVNVNNQSQVSESKLEHIIKSVLSESLLTEARSLGSAVDIFRKKNPNLNQDDLAVLMRSDPTFVSNDRGEFIGRYGMWIGNQYVKGNIKPGDRLELTHALNIYHINKSRIAKNINDVQSLDELVELIGNYDDSFKAQPTKGKHADELEKVYEDGTWVVYIPHTWEASRKIGGDTSWCTAASKNSYYNYYKNEYGGEYYVNVNKVTGEKYQFHFETNQFMDTVDNDIEKPVLKNMGATEGLVNFYMELTNDKPFHKAMLLYDEVRVISNEHAVISKNGKYNVLRVDGEMVFDQWFDAVWSFVEGFAVVRIGNKWNHINTDGKLLWNKPVGEWFDYVGRFSEGFAAVNIGKKWNYISADGKLLWDKPVEQWFDDCYQFRNGFARVKLNGNLYKIGTNGNLYDKDENPVNTGYGNNQSQVSESKLEHIIKSVISESLLTEARSLNSAVDIFRKKNPNLNQDDLSTLMRSDPTFVSNNRGEFIGRYGMWIGNQYVKGNIKLGDRLELSHALNIYDINKSRIGKKINDIHSLDELIDTIGDYDDSFKAQPTKGKHADELEKVYEDGTWAVYIPNTWEASRKIGGDTKWCTAASSDVYYNHYKNKYGGEYYVNVNKVTGEKYQFHFESNQFMDTEDNNIENPVLENMGATEGLVNFYRELTKDKPFHWEMFLYDSVRVISNEYAKVAKNGKYNVLRVDGKLLWNKPVEQWFDCIGDFIEGFALVRIGYKWNHFNTDGKLLWDKPVEEWFDEVSVLSEGFAKVRIGYKLNFIKADGKLLWNKPVKQWFDGVWGFKEGFARVRIGEKWNFINFDGKLLWDKPVEQWFDYIWDFDEGFAGVNIGKKWNHIGTNGKLLWNKPVEQWFDDVRYFNRGFACVKIGNKWNCINTDGKLLWVKPIELWFDDVWGFKEDFARVRIGEKYNYINTDGKLLLDKPVEEWFDRVEDFYNGYTRVKIGDKWNFINTDGKLLWNKPVKQWFDDINYFYNGFADVNLNGIYYKIDTNGNLYNKDGTTVNPDGGGAQSQVSESKLEHIIKSVLSESLLTEARSLDSAVDIFRKNNPNLNQDDLSTLMRSDPTFVSNDRGEFIGRYGMWIGNQYVKGNIKPGDRLELSHALNIYNINKSRIGKNINDVQSLDELVELIGDYDDSFKAQPTKGKHADELEKVYEDGTWVVYIPHTWEASRKIGGDTKWCTAGSSDNYYNHYKNKYGGEYYVNVNKVTGDKYQFHFESNQFMDKDDKEVKKPVLKNMGATGGLVNFYMVLTNDKPFHKAMLLYEYVRVISNEYAIIRKNGKSNIMFVDGKLLWDKPVKEWFDEVARFSEGFAAVNIGKKWNYIDINGRYITDQWFDGAGEFVEGFTVVRIGYKWNFINTDGKLLWNKPLEQWFDVVYTFKDGFARVKIGYKWNLINTNGKLLCDKPVEQWFDEVHDFNNGFSRVRLGKKWNIINTDGKLLWVKPIEQWFDDVWGFKEGFARVRIGEKWNFINFDGKLLWDKPVEQWFDYIWDFDEGFAGVGFGNKWNFINTDGKLLWNKPVKQWFDDIDYFYNGFADVNLNGKYYKIDTNGNLYDKDETPVNTGDGNNHSQVMEGRVKNIIRDVLNESLLTEARSLSNAVDIFRKNNPNLNQGDLEVLMRSDPTFVSNGRGEFIGRYGMWIGNQYVKGNIKPGDRLELTHALNIYDINKSRIAKKINDIHSLDELIDTIGDYDDSFKAHPTKGKHADELEKVYEDGTWAVYIPHTWEASRKIGGDTRWCTAASKDNYYNYYKNKYGGEYYVNVNKVTGDKYQFHFESKQFMDTDDKEVMMPVLENMRATDGLVNFYMELTKDKPFHKAMLLYEYVRVISNDYAIIRKKNGKSNIMCVDGKLLWNKPVEQWFDCVCKFSEGFAAVNIGKKWNFINTDGKLLWDKPVEEWFDYVWDFSEGFACVKIGYKWNFIKTDGKLLWDKPVEVWFDYVGDIYNGLALVELKGKYYKLDTNGNLYDEDGNAVNTVNVNNKSQVSESKLENIIKSVLSESLLTEARSLPNAVDIFRKNYPNLNQDDLSTLMRSDPTFVSNDRGEFIGRYGMWIGNQYVKGNIKPGDRLELSHALNIYDINKSRIGKNINDIQSLDELIDTIGDYDDSFKAQPSKGKHADELEKLYEDGTWAVYVPHTWEASRKIGGDTKWCTAASSDNYYNYYKNSHGGEYYVNVNKVTGKKYQFHFESNQFKNPYDKEVKKPVLDTIGATDGLVNFYRELTNDKPFDFAMLLYDEVSIISNEYAFITKKGKRNIMHVDGEIVSERWFDGVGEFSEGFAAVRNGKKWNYMDLNGRVLYNKWFDGVGRFSEGLAVVRIGVKWSFIDINGRYITDQWFDDVGLFYNGFAEVSIGNKWNFINTDGKLLWNKPAEQWFDDVRYFNRGFASVAIGNKCNHINTDGKLLLDKPVEEWFDGVGNFTSSFARVRVGKKWNFIDINGRILSNQWFDSVSEFDEGIAVVRIGDKSNLIDINGMVLYDNWFDYVGDFHDGFAHVRIGVKWSFIDINGRYITDQWFDDVGYFHGGFALVNVGKNFNFINTDGKLLWNKPAEQWFDGVSEFKEGFAAVRLGNKWNFINTYGKLLWNKPVGEWFDEVRDFINGFGFVNLNGKHYKIDTNGNLYNEDGKLINI